MKKFENITVLHVDDFDYTNPELLPEVVKAIDVADIVIREKRIVKNRLACTSGAMTETTSQQDNYEGICLEPDSFAVNVYHYCMQHRYYICPVITKRKHSAAKF